MEKLFEAFYNTTAHSKTLNWEEFKGASAGAKSFFEAGTYAVFKKLMSEIGVGLDESNLKAEILSKMLMTDEIISPAGPKEEENKC